MARFTSSILSGERWASTGPNWCFGTVWMLSMFAAQLLLRPSSGERKTSEGISRKVVVIGATVTAVKNPMAESRVRMRTGRRLSGALRCYLFPPICQHQFEQLVACDASPHPNDTSHF